MALRFLKHSAAAWRKSEFITRPTLVSMRSYSSPPPSQKQVEPTKSNFIDVLPGSSLAAKLSYLTAGTGLSAYLISKELYVLNEETLVLICFGGLVFSLGKYLRQPYTEWADAHINKQRAVLLEARENHKSAVQDRIDQVGQMKDVVAVTKALFDMSKDTAQMEAEIFELKQRVAMALEVKSVLDSWVRYEASVREREQKALAAEVITKVMDELQDPKLQEQILSESLADVDRILTSAKSL
ncbi:uncharacterized protein VTP21DRAFT_9907 [Calcarisporiella thermophila]|uniref:uncharacterized protein n=1 Tax=Calcarisporiella thermophila TaxID=911321 RepID=UPI00374439A7